MSALVLALATLPAYATETRWTGGAGASSPYWDLNDNWSAGWPGSPTMAARLGAFDTTLRRGGFQARAVTGNGELLVRGGELAIGPGGGRFGSLDLRGGTFSGVGDVTTRRLRWVDSDFVFRNSDCCEARRLIVTERAVLGGTVFVGGTDEYSLYEPVEYQFLGRTIWKGGESRVVSTFGKASLLNGRDGSFLDHASSGHHSLTVREFINDGTYEKTGEGISYNFSDGIVNNGLLRIRQGTLYHATHSMLNIGTTRMEGGRYEVRLGRFADYYNDGAVDIQNGTMSVSSYVGSIISTGHWTVGKQGQLLLLHDLQEGQLKASFASGTVRNDGLIQLTKAVAEFTGEATLSGTGALEVLNGARLSSEQHVQAGSLEVSSFGYSGSGFAFAGRIDLGQGMTIDRLRWRTGEISSAGTVLVRGRADLIQDMTSSSYASPPGKQMDGRFEFLGDTRWDGLSDIFGAGELVIGPAGTFLDEGVSGRARIDVARVNLAGVLRKTGGSATVVGSDFVNRGSVVAEQSGLLTFAGAFDNLGTVVSHGSRLVLFGPLAQADGNTLTGGVYGMRDGQIVLNLGGDQRANRVETNLARIGLDGPNARLLTTWLGTDVDALAGLQVNRGSLSLLGGARLVTDAPQLLNHGEVVIAGGSTLNLSAAGATFSQQRLDGEDTKPVVIWIDGVLKAERIELTSRFDVGLGGGGLGAGNDGTIGVGKLQAGEVFVGSGSILVDIDGTDADRLALNGGHLVLGTDSRLSVSFGPDPVGIGRYRILTGAGSIDGQFGVIEATHLDPTRFRLTALYGDTAVTLRVAPIAQAAAVPEPATWAMFALGLGLLGVLRRPRGIQA